MKLLLIFLMLSIPAYGQKQVDACGIITSVFNERERVATSNHLLTEFNTILSDKATMKSFKHPELALVINVGVQYLDFEASRKGQPQRIRVAISLSDTEQDAFHVTDNAVAGTRYGQNWGGLDVQKRVVIGEAEHTFIFYCIDGVTKRKK